MNTEIEQYLNTPNLQSNTSVFNVVIEQQIESRLNTEKIVFDYTELHLNYCYEVFKFYHDNKDSFTISECARVTKISWHNVNKIVNKYLKEVK